MKPCSLKLVGDLVEGAALRREAPQFKVGSLAAFDRLSPMPLAWTCSTYVPNLLACPFPWVEGFGLWV